MAAPVVIVTHAKLMSAGLRNAHQGILQQQTLHHWVCGHRHRWSHGESGSWKKKS